MNLQPFLVACQSTDMQDGREPVAKSAMLGRFFTKIREGGQQNKILATDAAFGWFLSERGISLLKKG